MFFIDFGNKAEVDTENIRCITEQLLNFPRLALRFTLKSAVSSDQDGMWSQDAIALMTTSVVNQPVCVHCIDITGERMNCEVVLSDGKKLSELLRLKGYSRFMYTELPKFSLDELNEFESLVVDAESPNDFHAWIGDLQSLHVEVQGITNQLALTASVTIPYTPIVGEVCAAYNELYQEWYRVHVIFVSQSSATVQLIDYGNKLDVQFEHLSSLNGQFCDIPARAVLLSLSGVCSSNNNGWNESAIILFKQRVEFKKSRCIKENVQNNHLLVQLTTADGENIAETLVESNFATHLSSNVNTLETIKRYYLTDITAYSPSSDEFEILVTHVKDPSLFHGRTTDISINKIIADMPDNMALKFHDMLPPSSYIPEVNEICAGYHPEYKEWYRVLITSLATPTATVMLVDFGDTVIIPYDQIRPLPAEFATLPVQAISFSLSTTVPVLGECWDETVIARLISVIQFQKITVKKVSMKDGVTNVVALTSSGVDVKSMLVGENLARDTLHTEPQSFTEVAPSSAVPVPPNTTDVTSHIPSSIKRYYLTDVTAYSPSSDEFEILVTHVKDPSLFHGRTTDISINKIIADMPDNMALKFHDMLPPSSYIPEVNEICAGYHPEYKEWYRVLITSLVTSNATVMLVDFGDTVIIPYDQIRPLPAEFATLPIQAMSFSLSTTVPVLGECWDETVTERLISVIQFQKITVKKVSMTDGVTNVVALTSSGVDVKSMLVAENLARDTLHTEPQSFTEAVPSSAVPVPPNTTVATAHIPSSIQRYYLSDITAYTPSSDEFQILVTHVKDPSLFHGRTTDISINQVIADMPDNMALKFHDMLPPSSYIPEVNEICAGYHPEYKEWYRVLITSLATPTATVMLVDFGDTVIIPYDQIRPLAAEFATLPIQAMSFSLLTTVPVLGECWDETVIARLISIIQFQKITVKKVSMTDGVTNVVALTSSGVDVKSMLVAENLARDIESGVIVSPNSVLAADVAIPVTTTPARIMYKDFPRLVLPTKGAIVTVSANSPSSFYGQLADIDRIKELDNLITELTDELSSDLSVYTPVEGEVCAAYFQMYDQFFRVKINKITDSTVTVSSLDYGNEETISLDDIAQLPQKYVKLHAQCVHLCLSGVKAKESSIADSVNDWSEECINYFKQQYVNVKCYYSILNCIDDCYSIEMSTDIIPDVSQDLIRLGYAVDVNARCSVNEPIESDATSSDSNTFAVNSLSNELVENGNVIQEVDLIKNVVQPVLTVENPSSMVIHKVSGNEGVVDPITEPTKEMYARLDIAEVNKSEMGNEIKVGKPIDKGK